MYLFETRKIREDKEDCWVWKDCEITVYWPNLHILILKKMLRQKRRICLWVFGG